MSTTYASGALWVRGLTDDDLRLYFPNANRPAHPIQAAFNVLGHFSLLVLAVAMLGFITINSVLHPNDMLASPQIILSAWLCVVLVGAGIFRSTYRYAGYGVVYVVGFVGSMAIGQKLHGDMASFYTTYMIVAALLAVGVALIRLAAYEDA